MARKDRAPLESAEVIAQQIGRKIAPSIGHGWGFVLLLASFGEDGRTTYISTCDRRDTVKLMREIADKIESDEPQV